MGLSIIASLLFQTTHARFFGPQSPPNQPPHIRKSDERRTPADAITLPPINHGQMHQKGRRNKIITHHHSLRMLQFQAMRHGVRLAADRIWRIRGNHTKVTANLAAAIQCLASCRAGPKDCTNLELSLSADIDEQSTMIALILSLT